VAEIITLKNRECQKKYYEIVIEIGGYQREIMENF